MPQERKRNKHWFQHHRLTLKHTGVNHHRYVYKAKGCEVQSENINNGKKLRRYGKFDDRLSSMTNGMRLSCTCV